MKFMTFNSSCAFAGLANMLELYGFETSCKEIAIRMNAPYIFAKENDNYITDAMLQNKKWFDLFLLQIGFELCEINIEKSLAAEYLTCQTTAMIGLQLTTNDKHAVTFVGICDNKFKFLNNKWQNDLNSPNYFYFSKEELLHRISDFVSIATIHEHEKIIVDFKPYLKSSLSILDNMFIDIFNFCKANKSKEQILASMNSLFRPLFLDSIAMMDIIGYVNIKNDLLTLQSQLMHSLKGNNSIPLLLLEKSVNNLKKIISDKLLTM